MEQAKIAFTKLANKIGLRKNPATMWQRRMWAEGIMCNFFVILIKINTSGGVTRIFITIFATGMSRYLQSVL